jgi:membrane protease YdiL (CAAX protease family)
MWRREPDRASGNRRQVFIKKSRSSTSLAIFQKLPQFQRIDSHVPKQDANPYRQILRRHVPEPVLALLLFLMGVWLWENHFGEAIGYEQGTCRIALVKIDRDLRLAEATAGLPPLLRTVLAIDDREKVLKTAVDMLDVLGTEQALSQEGKYALAILEPLRRGRDPATGPFAALGLPGPPDPDSIERRILAGSDAWWDREFLRKTGRPGASEVALPAGAGESDPRNRGLALRAIVARGAVWLLVLAGLGFLPHVFRSFARALRSRGQGYTGHWPVALGIAVFLLAYLASLGFGKAIDFSISGVPGGEGAVPVVLPSWLFVLLDAAARFVPALIALGLLFRRGRHAVDRLGLAARPDGALVLGSFALLAAIDQVLRHTLGASAAPDPTGGLSPMESGPWGLILALSSACIAAPVAEEILYRGVLFRSLANRLRVPAATLLSATVFAIVHFYTAYGLVSVGVLGAACALSFAATGRLTTAILLHALYNSAIKIPEWIVYHAPL